MSFVHLWFRLLIKSFIHTGLCFGCFFLFKCCFKFYLIFQWILPAAALRSHNIFTNFVARWRPVKSHQPLVSIEAITFAIPWNSPAVKTIFVKPIMCRKALFFDIVILNCICHSLCVLSPCACRRTFTYRHNKNLNIISYTKVLRITWLLWWIAIGCRELLLLSPHTVVTSQLVLFKLISTTQSQSWLQRCPSLLTALSLFGLSFLHCGLLKSFRLLSFC